MAAEQTEQREGELRYTTAGLAQGLLAELQEKGTAWLPEAAVIDIQRADAGERVRARLADKRPVPAERHLLLTNFPDLLVVAAGDDRELLAELDIDDLTLRAGLIKGAEGIGSAAHVKNLLGALSEDQPIEEWRTNADLHIRMLRFQKGLIARWGRPLAPREIHATDLIPRSANTQAR
jgi:hypothetical protein